MEMIGKETQINFKSCGQQKKQRLIEVLDFVICNCKRRQMRDE